MKFLICTRPPGIYPNHIPIADFSNLVAFYLKEKKQDVLILYTNRKPADNELKWLEEKKIKWKMWASNRNYPKSIKYFFILYNILKKEKPDAAEYHFNSVGLGMIASLMLGIKIRIIWIHSKFARQLKIHKIRLYFQKLRSKMFATIATTIIANSNSTQKQLLEYFSINPSKVYIQYLGIYLDKNLKLDVTREQNTIVCVGRLVHLKGQHILIKAIAEIVDKFPNIKVLFIGGGNNEDLVRLATDLEVLDNCFFLGDVSRDKVFEILSRSAIAVFPTLFEAFGLAAVEALACGCPLIASRTGGLLDIIEENKSGIFVEPGNINELAKAISTLLMDKKKRDELSINGINRANFFEIHKRAESYADWLISYCSKEKK